MCRIKWHHGVGVADAPVPAVDARLISALVTNALPGLALFSSQGAVARIGSRGVLFYSRIESAKLSEVSSHAPICARPLSGPPGTRERLRSREISSHQNRRGNRCLTAWERKRQNGQGPTMKPSPEAAARSCGRRYATARGLVGAALIVTIAGGVLLSR